MGGLCGGKNPNFLPTTNTASRGHPDCVYMYMYMYIYVFVLCICKQYMYLHRLSIHHQYCMGLPDFTFCSTKICHKSPHVAPVTNIRSATNAEMQKISQIGVLLSYYSHCWYNINVVFVLSFLFQVAGIQRVEMEKTFLALYINTCWIVWFHVVVMLNLYCCWICNSVLLLEFKELRCSRDKTFPAPLKLKIVENSGNWCHLHWCPRWCHAHWCHAHWCPHWCH